MPTDAARLALCRDALRAGAVRPRHAELAAAVEGDEAEALAEQIRAALDHQG